MICGQISRYFIYTLGEIHIVIDRGVGQSDGSGANDLLNLYNIVESVVGVVKSWGHTT